MPKNIVVSGRQHLGFLPSPKPKTIPYAPVSNNLNNKK